MQRAFSSKSLRDGGGQIITFTLEDSWKLPALYETGAVKDVQTMFELGAECFVAVQGIAGDAANAVAKGVADERVEKRIADMTKRIHDVERRSEHEIEMLNRERAALNAEIEKLRAKCAGMAAEAAERAETIRMAAAAESEGRVAELRATVEGLRGTILGEDARRAAEIERAVAAKESMIAYLMAEKERADATARELQEALLARGKVRASAVLKGKEGEEDFEEAARDMGWGLVRTGKESHQCDYKGSVGGMDVFFEIKAHAETIPSKEITKFQRDMKEHPEIGAGVFVALHAPLRASGGGGAGGQRAGFWVDWTDDGRLLVFIGELFDGPMPVAGALRVIGQMLEVAAKIWKARGDGETGAAALLEGRLRMGVKYLEGAAERLRVIYNKVVIDRKAAADAYDGTLGMLKMVREEIALTLGTLLGTHSFVCDEGGERSGAGGTGEAGEDESEEIVKEPPKKKARRSGSGENIKKTPVNKRTPKISRKSE